MNGASPKKINPKITRALEKVPEVALKKWLELNYPELMAENEINEHTSDYLWQQYQNLPNVFPSIGIDESIRKIRDQNYFE